MRRGSNSGYTGAREATAGKRICQKSRREAQEPARLHLRDNGAAARAGRTLRRGTGIHHQLARSLKLRDLHAIAAGTDGRRAARVRARRKGARVTQEVQGPGLINRGLRAPFPYKELSVKLQAASKPQALTKLQAASAKLQATSHKQQAPGCSCLDKVSGIADLGSLLRYTCLLGA